MDPINHEHVNLLLRLYELRREEKLRRARQWLVSEFQAANLQELRQKYPPGSEQEPYLRMVTSYWDMVAVIVNRGALDEDLFMATTGEHFLVWEKIKHIVPEIRAAFKNPLFLENLEKLAARTIEWREQRAPGSTEAFRQMVLRTQTAR